MLPDIEIPRISIVIELENHDRTNVEELLVAPLIDKLAQGNGVKDILATLDDQKAKFDLTFEFGTDMDFAYLEVTDLTEVVLRNNPYPNGRPVIFRHNLSDLPILFLQISSSQTEYSEIEFSKLSDYTYNRLKRQLEQLREVAFVDIAGGQFEEIVINPKMETLEALKVNESVIYNALERRNLNLRTYSIKQGNYYRTLQINSEIENIEALRNISILIGSRVFKLDELAQISTRLQSNNGLIVSNGDRAISLAVIKSGSSRIEELKEQVEVILKDTEQQFPDLKFQITRDQSQLLGESLRGLKTSLLLGLLFSGLAVFVLNRNIFHTTIILVNVPIALAITFLCFELLGLTINIVTLSGLTICVGLMIDNTIIVLDNMARKQGQQSFWMAAEIGTLEVIRPLLTSMLTTCSLFIPLIFMSGLAGALFYDQALTIATGLVVSFLIAITFLPTFYAYLSTRDFQYSQVRTVLRSRYHHSLSYIYNHAEISLGAFVVFLALSIWHFQKVQYTSFPEITEDYTVMDIQWEESSSSQLINNHINTLYSQFRDQISTFNAYIGSNDFILDETKGQRAHEARIIFRQKSTSTQSGVLDSIRSYLSYYHPYSKYETYQSKTPITYIFSVAQKAPVTLYQRKGLETTDYVGNVSKKLEQLDTGAIVQNTGTIEKVYLHYDPQKLKQYGVEFNVFANRMRLLLDQLQYEKLNNRDLRAPLTFTTESNQLIKKMATSQVINTDSLFVPLRNLVSIEWRSVPARRFFDRKGEFEPLEIKNMKSEHANQLTQLFSNEIRQGELELERNPSLQLDFWSELTFIFLISLTLLYFILAIQFESLVQPLIILSEIPVGISGGIWLLMLFGGTFNIMAGIGLVFLAGIMINDSILKIDQINRQRLTQPLEEAIKNAGKFRFNAIIATSFTTIASLVPLIAFDNLGSELQRPLALVLVGGMITSTIASLYLVPIVYKFIYKNK